MLKYIALTTTFLINTFVFCQAGLFLTHEDYENNLITSKGEYIRTYSSGKKYKIEFRNENKSKNTVDIDKNAFWGYKDDIGVVRRIDDQNRPFVIISEGLIVLYVENIVKSQDGTFNISMAYPPMISDGTDGKMQNLTKENLEDFFSDRQDIINALESVKDKPHTLAIFIITLNAENK